MHTKCRKVEPHELADPENLNPLFLVEPPHMVPFTVAFRADTPIENILALAVDAVLARAVKSTPSR